VENIKDRVITENLKFIFTPLIFQLAQAARDTVEQLKKNLRAYGHPLQPPDW